MKKQKLLHILSVLLIAALSISLFTACHKIEEIEESQVASLKTSTLRMVPSSLRSPATATSVVSPTFGTSK